MMSPEWVTAGFTVILAIITGIYAFLTHRQAEASRLAVNYMEKQLKASTRPYVVFDLVTDGALISAQLTNHGTSAAYDVKLEIGQKITVYNGMGMMPPALFTQIIPSVVPGKIITELLGSYQELEEQIGKTYFEGTISYQDGGGENYFETVKAGADYRKTMPYIGRPNAEDELKKIREVLTEISRLISRFKP